MFKLPQKSTLLLSCFSILFSTKIFSTPIKTSLSTSKSPVYFMLKSSDQTLLNVAFKLNSFYVTQDVQAPNQGVTGCNFNDTACNKNKIVFVANKQNSVNVMNIVNKYLNNAKIPYYYWLETHKTQQLQATSVAFMDLYFKNTHISSSVKQVYCPDIAIIQSLYFEYFYNKIIWGIASDRGENLGDSFLCYMLNNTNLEIGTVSVKAEDYYTSNNTSIDYDHLFRIEFYNPVFYKNL